MGNKCCPASSVEGPLEKNVQHDERQVGSSNVAPVVLQQDERKMEPVAPPSQPAPLSPDNPMLNGINAMAVRGMKAKMREDPQMGKAFPVQLVAELDVTTGIVKGPGGLVAAPMPHTAQDGTDPTLATPLSYCPVFAAACYSLVVLIDSAERGMVLDEYSAETEALADMGMFYNLEVAKKGGKPWPRVDVSVAVKGGMDDQELQEVGSFAHEHCPASQILQSDSIRFESTIKGSPAAEQGGNAIPDGVFNGYDLSKYKQFADKVGVDGKALFKQASRCRVYCGEEQCAEYPGALMQLWTTGNGRGIPTAMDAPVGKGNYPNPVACCLFGACSFYVHTLALRLSLRGVAIQALKATLSTVMNKRVMMNLDDDKTETFDHMKVDVEVECSDASAELLEEVRREADLMCPSVPGMTRSVMFEVEVRKMA